ncbi:MAG TPA: cupin domain-containing protein [Candidatus Bathyarchaeia archaeon]|nr:cupin domain-containing protein [Candidatus Bathyarchaeia archaeon]
MDAFELADVAAERETTGRPYLEFITVPDLSVGLYVLAAGQPDLQQPHLEDEVYYVVSGRGRVTVGADVRDVRAGSIVFVAATVPHRFHDIVEDLTLFVAFGPAEGSRANANGVGGASDAPAVSPD